MDMDIPHISWLNQSTPLTPSPKLAFQKPPIEFPLPLFACNPLITCPKRLVLDKPPIPTYQEFNPNKSNYLYKNQGSWDRVPTNILRKFILFPELLSSPFANMEMLPYQSLEKLPFHLPDLSDIETHFPALVFFVKWSLFKRSFREFLLLPPELTFLLDPSPVFPQLRYTYKWTSLPLEIEIASYANALLITQTQKSFFQINLKAQWRPNESKPGRTLFTRMLQLESPPPSSSASTNKGDQNGAQRRAREAQKHPTNIVDPMTILFWNVRGVCRPSFQRNISHLIQQHYPSMIIISETRTNFQHTEIIVSKTPFDCFVLVEARGFSGGILVMWKSCRLEFNSTSRDLHAIHRVVTGAPQWEQGSDPIPATKKTELCSGQIS